MHYLANLQSKFSIPMFLCFGVISEAKPLSKIHVMCSCMCVSDRDRETENQKKKCIQFLLDITVFLKNVSMIIQKTMLHQLQTSQI